VWTPSYTKFCSNVSFIAKPACIQVLSAVIALFASHHYGITLAEKRMKNGKGKAKSLPGSLQAYLSLGSPASFSVISR